MHNMQDIVIVGIGPIAEMAWAYFNSDSDYHVVAFSGEAAYLDGRYTEQTFMGLPIVALEDLPAKYPPSQYKAFVALGYDKLNHGRARLYQQMLGKGYELVSYISTKAFIDETCQIGKNCFILENNVLQRNVIIGDDVFLWSGNHIGHSSTIGDHVFLSSHVAVSGFCKIGKYCFLGINSCTGDNLAIGENCFIGGGVSITRNTKTNEIYRMPMPKPERLAASTVFGFHEEFLINNG